MESLSSGGRSHRRRPRKSTSIATLTSKQEYLLKYEGSRKGPTIETIPPGRVPVGLVPAKAGVPAAAIDETEAEHDSAAGHHLINATHHPNEEEPLSMQEKIQQLLLDDSTVSSPCQKLGEG